jgi:hypothetical protein
VKSPRPSLAQFRGALTQWFPHTGASDHVAFREVIEPPEDPTDDYRVVYEATFEPASLDKARMETWLTDDGYVSVGLETRARIAKRLGVPGKGPSYAAGHEPGALSVDELLSLLDAAAEGHLAIIARANRLFGVWSTNAAMDPEVYDWLKAGGHRDLDWIARLGRQRGHILRFRPWRED